MRFAQTNWIEAVLLDSFVRPLSAVAAPEFVSGLLIQEC